MEILYNRNLNNLYLTDGDKNMSELKNKLLKEEYKDQPEVKATNFSVTRNF